MEGLVDTTLKLAGRDYRVCWYRCSEHGGWRCEASVAGRVVEVIDMPSVLDVLNGMIKVLARRTGANGRR